MLPPKRKSRKPRKPKTRPQGYVHKYAMVDGMWVRVPSKKKTHPFVHTKAWWTRKNRRNNRKPLGPRTRRMSQPYAPSIYMGVEEHTIDNGKSWIPGSLKLRDLVGGMEWERTTHDEIHAGPPYREGGPFSSFFYKYPMELVNVGIHQYGGSYRNYRYNGGFTPAIPWASASGGEFDINNSKLESTGKPNMNSAKGDTYSYGARAWNKYRPGGASADAGQFLWEFGDTPRMLATTAKGFADIWKSMGGSSSAFAPKNVADHWVNTQFGWRPFLNDIDKFIKTYQNVNKNLAQIKRDNGQWVRRGGSVAQLRESSVVLKCTTGSVMLPVLNSYAYQGLSAGHYTISREYTKNVWFRGAFRYWIPDMKSNWWKPKTITQMFGLYPCPSLIWQVLPWSWFYDWQTNLGTVIDNMSSGWASNLAAKYAYVMGHTNIALRCDDCHTLASGTYNSTWYAVQEWKRREVASPFGFGLSTRDFTARQWSILAALAITKW